MIDRDSPAAGIVASRARIGSYLIGVVSARTEGSHRRLELVGRVYINDLVKALADTEHGRRLRLYLVTDTSLRECANGTSITPLSNGLGGYHFFGELATRPK